MTAGQTTQTEELELVGLRRRRRYLLERDGVLGPLLLLPTVIYLIALVGLPLVLVILYSFSNITTSSTTWHLTGIGNFVSAINNPVFRTALRNTVVFTVISQALVVVLSVVLAFALSRDFRGKWFLRFFILLPWAAPIALGALAWLWLLDSIFSPLDWVLAATGIIHHGQHVVWLGSSHLAMGSVIAVQTWRMLPLSTVILMAGLTSIPQDITDAAEVDGAGFWRKLFGVTMPLLTPVIMVALLFGIVFTFTDITVVYILTNGGPNNATQVLANWAFLQGIRGGDLAQGAAVALFMFPVLLGLAALMLRIASRAEVS